MVSSFITLVCLLGLINLFSCEPQGPPQSNLLANIVTQDRDNVPPVRPPQRTDDVGPPGTIDAGNHHGRMLGYRCPYPPDENGRWPEYCYDVIGDHCECFFDDIVVRQQECVRNNITLYEELLHIQMRLERERDIRRHEQGLGSRPQAYQHVLDCLELADEIMLNVTRIGAPGHR